MSVRFEPAARRAIDRAMTEVERRGHATLDTLHLLLGLLSESEAPAGAALRALDVSAESLRLAASGQLLAHPAGDPSRVEVAAATEHVLERAHRLRPAVRTGANCNCTSGFIDGPQARGRDAGVVEKRSGGGLNVLSAGEQDV